MSATTNPRALTTQYGAGALPAGMSVPVADNIVIQPGWMVAADASGNLVPAITSTAISVIGASNSFSDNTAPGHAAGAVSAAVIFGAFPWNNSTAGDAITNAQRFSLCYAVDNQTVAKTSGTGTRVPAGIVLDVQANGVGPSQVLVLMGPEIVGLAQSLAGIAALTALTDSTGGTVSNTLAALNGGTLAGVDGTGSNAAPLAGVNTALGVIRNALASLAAKVDAIIAAA